MRYGIATIFEEFPDGYKFSDDNTPLHLTHIDVLEIDINPESFVRGLREHLKNQFRFKVMPLKDTFFGPEKDIPVTLIEQSPKLMEYHSHLVQYLETKHAKFDNPQYLKDGYIPHISIYGIRRVAIGKPIIIKSISVGHKRTDVENPPNRIIATIPLL
ncbi:MAG: hypothetical protein NVSMB46_04790 [Candidatus Saccharimonadales bacterium]